MGTDIVISYDPQASDTQKSTNVTFQINGATEQYFPEFPAVVLFIGCLVKQCDNLNKKVKISY